MIYLFTASICKRQEKPDQENYNNEMKDKYILIPNSLYFVNTKNRKKWQTCNSDMYTIDRSNKSSYSS